MPPRQIIVLTGVPGVGKTAVAKILADRLGGLHIDLSRLVIQEGMIDEVDENRGAPVASLEKIRELVTERIVNSRGNLVIEGHFAHSVVPRDLATLVFVLRRSPWALKEDLEARGYDGRKVRENVEAELIGVCLTEAFEEHGPDRVCEIDTSNRSADETAEEMLNTMKGERKCASGIVDWLGRVETQRMLEDWKGCT